MLLLPSTTFAAVELAPTPTCVTIQTERWNELKNNNKELVMKLLGVELLLQTLNTPQTELQTQLAEAKAQVLKLQEALTLSEEKLKNAESLQKEMLSSLMDLEKKIDAERRAQAAREKRLRRQRDTWLFVAGACLLGYIGK